MKDRSSSFVFVWAHVFAFLCLLFIPASFYFFPFQDNLAEICFSWLPNLFQVHVYGFTSDTLALNLLVLFLLFAGLGLTWIIKTVPATSSKTDTLLRIIRTLMIYYLASRLMVYGFDKILKTQFYLPEPNTLYTPLGYLGKDMLFWSAVGTSKWYCIISGIMEVIPAVLLLFRKTRITGLILTLFVLSHVLAINIGFDISVKLYSLFLLFLTIVLLFPFLQQLGQFFFFQKAVKLDSWSGFDLTNRPLKNGLKMLLIGLIFVEALKFPITNGFFSDDDLPRMSLHGAYEVRNDFNDNTSSIKRFFIHRNGFLIFQYVDETMKSMQLILDEANSRFDAVDESGEVNKFSYEVYTDKDLGETELWLLGYSEKGVIQLVGKQLDLTTLPALQDDFHWVIDKIE